MEHKRTGRPSKGVRHRIPVRVRPELADAIAERAGQLGITMNDYLTELAERDLQLAAPQQRLPMAG